MKLFQRISLIFLLMFMIVGCNRVDLYTNLDEKDANEMQAILLRQGIDCDKIPGKEMTWGLKLAKNQMAAAVEILKGYGYPKENFANMGDMFKKKGLVSSPMQDRIRFVYALSQEISETISNIEGVINARVHVVLPENDPLSEYFQPSSASVFIKHQDTMNIQQYIHPIKQLVVNSIEGLSYEKVSLVPFATTLVSAVPTEYIRVLGIKIDASYESRFCVMVYGLAAFLLVSMLFNLSLLWKNFSIRRFIRKDVEQSKHLIA